MRATDKQLNFLDKLGVEYSPDINVKEAWELIDKATKKPKDITNEYGSEKAQVNNSRTIDKDTLIVRQSSMDRATALVCAGKIPIGEMLAQAQEIEEWVFR